ncbi:prepilin-type N-terminal cleavage/methylation domain-containing protein [Ferrimonas senticii]|uniref:prepilin-type N-terminal cleavage/methylation domain-containing protein n=1 Tax=Ferrimonas senticii TaxID=394566 RepID=UPI0006842EE3|nr:prepilin-type N-terminal cleavage/methylation domain-containing protein [Ferrimonas senticii]
MNRKPDGNGRLLLRGFTLVELVIVLLLIALLAVVASVKYVDLSANARIATLKAVAAAMKGGAEQIRIKTYLPGTEKVLLADQSTDSLKVHQVTLPEFGTTVTVYNGYVQGHWNKAWTYILDLGKTIEFTQTNQICSKNDLCGVGNQRTAPGFPEPPNNSRGLVLVWLKGMKLNDQCYAYYSNRHDGFAPTIGIVDSGC